jgi:hypothetical protein
MKIVDFQWWRCLDGYRLDQTDERFILTPQGRRPMRRTNDDVDRKSFSLTSASGRFEQYRPLEIESLFAIFADTPASPRGMQDFCNRFGLLGEGRPDLAPFGKRTSESALVDDELRHHRRLRTMLHHFQRDDLSELARYWNWSEVSPLIRTELRPGPDGRLEMVLAPPDLIRALWLQFALFACKQARLLRCERCNTPFVVGSGTGRRGTSKWCSNACKVAAFKEREAQREARK